MIMVLTKFEQVCRFWLIKWRATDRTVLLIICSWPHWCPWLSVVVIIVLLFNFVPIIAYLLNWPLYPYISTITSHAYVLATRISIMPIPTLFIFVHILSVIAYILIISAHSSFDLFSIAIGVAHFVIAIVHTYIAIICITAVMLLVLLYPIISHICNIWLIILICDMYDLVNCAIIH